MIDSSVYLYFEFQLIDECNWNCSYCNYAYTKCKSKDRVKVCKHTQNSLLTIKKILDKLHNKIRIFMLAQGGEIGLLSEKELDFFFETMYPYKFTISTNGAFIDKNYHVRYKDSISQVHLHLVEDLTNNVQPYNLTPLIIPGVVSTNYNITDIDCFIKSNPSLKYFDFELPLQTTVTPKIWKNIVDCRRYIINNYPNLYDKCDNNIRSFDVLRSHQKGCIKFNKIITFDLVSNTIHPCSVKNKHISIELTQDNIIKLLCGYNVFASDLLNCGNCMRCCFTFDSMYTSKVIKLKQSLSKLLITV